MIQAAVGVAPWFALIPLVWANLRPGDAARTRSAGDVDSM